MKDEITQAQAMILFEQGYRMQVQGKLSDAVEMYKRSIAIHPTAEAYTFLGWSYSMTGRLDEAIEMCEQAIEIDPTFGNPYNDIGAYKIEQGQYEDAIPYLEDALAAPRYKTPQFAYMNLGRAYQNMGRYRTALEHFNQSLAQDPLYLTAEWAKASLLAKMN